jgi:hypothetical protein
MPDTQRRLDIGSRLVVLMTFVLFVAALFVKGFGHDLLLETGVFLVSVKLIIMAYKNSVTQGQVTDRLDGLQTNLTRMESLLESRRSTELAVGPPNKALQPTGVAPRSDEAKGGDRVRG